VKKIVLLMGIMIFITNHSFARDMADDLKARQGQFTEELGELSGQEAKVVKNINDSVDRYSKNRDIKILQQIIDGKTKLISILQKEQDVFQDYVNSLEKDLSEVTNRDFIPLGKK